MFGDIRYRLLSATGGYAIDFDKPCSHKLITGIETARVETKPIPRIKNPNDQLCLPLNAIQVPFILMIGTKLPHRQRDLLAAYLPSTAFPDMSVSSRLLIHRLRSGD